MSAPVILEYLEEMGNTGASDLYLTVGVPPSLRVDGNVRMLTGRELTVDDINTIITSVLTSRQRHEFDTKMELNTSLDAGKYGRFRINVMRQRQKPALGIRRISSKIPTVTDLNLPSIIKAIASERRGLVLVTGQTGSGKSTTLAAMIDHRNENEHGHIITIEDPIEYHHDHKKSIVSQREVGVDTESYSIALKNALRQRPDIILVGEIRDAEVMEQALSASETGHLCLSTLHTNNAYQSIDRIVNMFSEEYHQQIRMSLAASLRAIISQRLVPNTRGGLSLAIEVMLNQGLVRELIRKGEITKIRDVMEQNRQLGMCTFDQSLLDLYKKGEITAEMAIEQADQGGDMKIRIQNDQMGDTSSGDAALKSMDTSILSISDQ